MHDTDTPTRRAEILTESRDFPFFRLIGLEILDVEPARSSAQVNWRPDLRQPVGLLHGGVVTSLVDTGTAYALLLCDELRETFQAGGSLVTIDLRVKYLRPVSGGSITCTSQVSRMGRQIIHVDAVVTGHSTREVARSDAIYTTVTPNTSSSRPNRRRSVQLIPERRPEIQPGHGVRIVGTIAGRSLRPFRAPDRCWG